MRFLRHLKYSLLFYLTAMTLACIQSPQSFIERLATIVPEPAPILPEAVQIVRANALEARLLVDGNVAVTTADSPPQILATVVADYGSDYWTRFPYDLQWQNLDDDNRPELILIVSTPGASCCTTLSVAYFNEAQNQYQLTDALYRKYTLGFDVVDLDGDGVVEFRTLNEDFNYALGGASVVSFYSPLQIWRFEAGRLIEVTAEFPSLVQDHADYWLEDEELLCSIFGAGAYLAEMAMLDQIEVGWATIATRCTLPADELALIQQTLQTAGYTTVNNQ